MIDATVFNIALPAIGHDLHAGFAGLQWTINSYTLTLASLILVCCAVMLAPYRKRAPSHPTAPPKNGTQVTHSVKT